MSKTSPISLHWYLLGAKLAQQKLDESQKDGRATSELNFLRKHLKSETSERLMSIGRACVIINRTLDLITEPIGFAVNSPAS